MTGSEWERESGWDPESTTGRESNPGRLAYGAGAPASPKTVFFWAPWVKWGLVIAGISDFTRPAEKLSTYQSAVLTTTGFIWARYSLVIIPRVWNLFAVNSFLGLAGSFQLFRIWRTAQLMSPMRFPPAELVG
ncbi:hypothetical protein AALO_G00228520 [Alosa alosa]|uniref:Mitochondrial pyruvate carrier n=1 Tax=Alosa alosa TaxID=278164 RepID=A0AAV6FYV8_9TELE|nr:hypothetical protein AALO_G00228520 [Alosa alosa]